MQFLRADADFGTHTELEPVGKTGAGIHIDASRIHALLELARVFVISGHDAFAVFGAISGNMLQRLVQIPHHLDGKDQVVIFGSPVLVRSCYHVTAQFLRSRIAAHFHAFSLQFFNQRR
jgi:hypothetical protein